MTRHRLPARPTVADLGAVHKRRLAACCNPAAREQRPPGKRAHQLFGGRDQGHPLVEAGGVLSAGCQLIDDSLRCGVHRRGWGLCGKGSKRSATALQPLSHCCLKWHTCRLSRRWHLLGGFLEGLCHWGIRRDCSSSSSGLRPSCGPSTRCSRGIRWLRGCVGS